jgi:hypothetical protein
LIVTHKKDNRRIKDAEFFRIISMQQSGQNVTLVGWYVEIPV